MILQLGEWLPDWAKLSGLPGNELHTTVAKNVYPMVGGYGQIPSFVTALSQTALTTTVKGIDAFPGSGYVAGTDSDLYYAQSQLGAWTIVTPAAFTVVAGGTSTRWEFVEWRGRVFGAIHENNGIYEYTFAATAFSLMTTSVQPNHIGIVNNFLVAGNLTDGAGYTKDRVRWSGIGTPASWTAGANQADFEDLNDGGAIQRIIGGDVGFIMQESAIRRMTYVGTPTIFAFDKVESAVGVLRPESVVQVGGLVYYLAADGFHVFDGVRSRSISEGKIGRWLISNSDRALQADRASFTCEGIKSNHLPLIYWSYTSVNSVGGGSAHETVVVYNYVTDAWSWFELDHHMLAPSLDVDFELYAINHTNRSLQSANRLDATDALSAFIETAYYAAAPGRKTTLKRAQVMVDGVQATSVPNIAAFGVDRLDLGVTSTFTYGIAQTSGWTRIRKTFRYIKLGIKQNANFDLIYGVDVDHALRGKR